MSLVPLLLLGIFLGIPSVVPPAHAAGTVCFNDPASFSTSAPCAPAGTALNGPAPTATLTQAIPVGNVRGTNQIHVGIYLAGPDLINGFDITVLTNRAVLRPAAVDFSNTILASPTSIVVECLDGALVTGPTCLATDVPGTIHLSLSGAAGVLSTANTGLLFTAIYNITGKTPSSGQNIQFQTGCGSPTSPTSDPPICVTITNGGSGPVSESVGTIGFNNSVDPNWVAISTPSSTTYSFLVGAASPVVSVSATAENGYPGLVGTDSVSFTTIQSAGLTVSFTGAVTTCATGGLTCSVSVSFGGAAGTYFVSFFGNYVYSNDTTLSPDGTLDGTVSLVVNIQDVTWSINGANEYPAPTTAQTLYMGTGPTHPMPLFFTVTSVGGYSNTITYSTAALTGTTGLVFAYPPVFTLGAGQTVTKIINGTATTTGTASYVARIVAGGFAGTTGTHSSAVQTVKVSGFTLTSNSTSVTFASGGSGHVQLTSTSLGNPPATNGFAGSVALTAPFTGPAGGVLTFTFTPASSITLTPGSTGSVTVTISGTIAGPYSVTFTGKGGTNNDMTNSTVVSVTISGGMASPTIATTLSATTIVVGQTVTDSSTLTGATATAGGTVSYLLFLNGACTAPSSTVSIVTVTNAVVPNSRAVLFNATGSYSFQASYSGDTGNNPALSPCEPLTVNKANTSTSLTSSANPSVFGQSVTFTATVSVTAPGAGSPAGNVNFLDGVTVIGSCTLPAAAPFTCTFSTAALSVATHSITATYVGNANFNTSTSTVVSQVVNKANTSTSLTSSVNPSVFGQSVTFTATVTVTAPGAGSPTGTVNFLDGATVIGSCSLPAAAPFTCTFSTAALSVATHSITATYVGNANFNTSTSAPVSQVVNKASTSTSLASSLNPSVFGQSVTFTATVTVTAPGAGTPTGTVNFLDGATTIGSCTL